MQILTLRVSSKPEPFFGRNGPGIGAYYEVFEGEDVPPFWLRLIWPPCRPIYAGFGLEEAKAFIRQYREAEAEIAAQSVPQPDPGISR